jgi:hypothetical protein
MRIKFGFLIALRNARRDRGCEHIVAASRGLNGTDDMRDLR